MTKLFRDGIGSQVLDVRAVCYNHNTRSVPNFDLIYYTQELVGPAKLVGLYLIDWRVKNVYQLHAFPIMLNISIVRFEVSLVFHENEENHPL